MWPELAEELAAIPEPTAAPAKPRRPDSEILEELVETVRGFGWQLNEVRARAAVGSERRVVWRAADLAGQWAEVITELKRRKQALSAAVYGEARVEGFDGRVLTLAFPEDQGYYVEMAKDRKHADVLGEVLEERIGYRPRLEIRG